MRLWHQDLIPVLPNKQLLGQHRECAALRGNGWQKKHATVDYAFSYNPYRLVCYHYLIIQEMVRRGYRPDPLWLHPAYRGKHALPFPSEELKFEPLTKSIYPEHDDDYFQQCIDNLKQKGITLPLHLRTVAF